ncbi:P-loop containing nucleoside triphosphate hydrolase protein [Aspergillus unguis]
MLSASEHQPAPVPSHKISAHVRTTTPISSSNSTSDQAMSMPSQPLQHIWVVTGPAGSGKSTVGRYLQQELGVPFLEGDDFHPPANKAKMSTGTPLTDADRWDWLISLRSAATTILSPSVSGASASASTQAPSGVVVACSALKKKYRDVMRVAAYGSPNVRIHFVYLKLEPATLFARVSARQAHYMKQGMVESQLRDLEEPEEGEWDCLTVEVMEGTGLGEVQRSVSRVVEEVLVGYQNGTIA